MAWSPRGNLKGPMGDNLVSSPTLVTDFNDAVNTNGKSQSFSVAGAMSNGPPGGLQAYAPVLYLQSHASSTGGPITRTGMQITFDRFNSGVANPQAMWIRTVSNTSFGAWLRIVDEVLLADALDVINGTLALKADDSNVVHKTGNENVDGEKTFLKSIRVATGDSNGQVSVSSIPGKISDFTLEANGVARWVLRCQNDVESGGNTGSTFSLRSRDDSGVQLNTIFSVDRPTGVLNFPQVAPTIFGNTIWHAGNSNFDSGTLTPDCTEISNAASCSANPCSFTRVGNSVVYSGSVSVTPSVANSASIVSIALPVASNFSSGTDASGPVSGKAAGVPSFEIGQIFAEAGTGRLRVHFYPATTNDYTMRFCIVYPILT